MSELAGGSRPAPRVWLDGRVLPADQAVVSVHDRAFRGGEGVFETIRVYGRHPFRLDAHVERACAGGHAVGIELAAERLREGVRAVVAANAALHGEADSVVRITVSAGCIDPASPFPGTPPPGAAGEPTVAVTSHRFVPDASLHRQGSRAVSVALARELPQVKSVSYLAALTARREARQRGADEALLTTGDGYVLEAASANVAFVRDGALVTPPVASGLLAGVTRRVLLELAPSRGLRVLERPVHRDELLAAEEAVLTASTREVVPLVELDEQPIGSGRPGPQASGLLAAYRAEVRRERDATR